MNKSLTTKHIYCVPGDRLCVSDDLHISGLGTYIFRDYIYASLCGVVQVKTSKDGQQKTVKVVHNVKGEEDKLPAINSIVTCRVLYVNSAQAKCQINCVNERLLKLPFKAILRKEDVRELDKNRVEMHECFRSRDIIVARVFGMSDKGYLLTTAEDGLGVVIAYNDNYSPLVPISWTEMVCPETYVKEKRKVAKILAVGQSTSESVETVR